MLSCSGPLATKIITGHLVPGATFTKNSKNSLENPSAMLDIILYAHLIFFV